MTASFPSSRACCDGAEHPQPLRSLERAIAFGIMLHLESMKGKDLIELSL
ncbi:hypothetical protein [Scytonema sp. PRP1]